MENISKLRISDLISDEVIVLSNNMIFKGVSDVDNQSIVSKSDKE